MTDSSGRRLLVPFAAAALAVLLAWPAGAQQPEADASETVPVYQPDGAVARTGLMVPVYQPDGTDARSGSNQPPVPVGSMPDKILHVHGRAVLDISRAFMDPDSYVLIYGAVSTDRFVARVSVAGAQLTIQPALPGVVVITVTATDMDGASAVQRFTVTVPDGREFTDDPIVPGVTPIRAIHFMELRSRVRSMRARRYLPIIRWTDRALTVGVTPIKLVHLMELREAVDGIFDHDGLSRPVYTDATTVQAVHIAELRAAAVAVGEW